MAEKVKKEKKPKTTLQKYKLWRNWDIGLTAAKFAAPAVPFGIVTGLNWDRWVDNSPSTGWSIGIGFGMLIVATISAILGIMKKDEVAKQKVSGVLYVAIILAIIGFSFKLLASIMSEMGDMFLYVAAGTAGSFTIDQVDKLAIKPEAQRYKKLVEDNGLSKSAARRMDDAEQAQIEGQKAKAERVRYNPHD